MKLTELNPRWVTFSNWVSTDLFIIGITFLCPHCQKTRIGVMFRNPIDPANLIGRQAICWTPPEKGWERQGDTFENISLSPSIDVSSKGHWHGFVELKDGVTVVR